MIQNVEELPVVSIMIATFNSEKLLPRTLEAIRKQTYPQGKIDLMIVDGGSSDLTLSIAKQFGCRILKNEKTEPINAKLIGASYALGKYLVTIDHDEVLEDSRSIEKRVYALLEHPECKVALCSGYKRPKDYPGINEYISEFGDPFSLFIYNFPKGAHYFEKEIRKHFQVETENGCYLIVDFSSNSFPVIMELCCLATMIDMDYFRKIPNAFEDASTTIHLFYEMLSRGDCYVILSKNDALLHYSADSIKAYLPKLKWRVCNNIFFDDMGKSGFSGRAKAQNLKWWKKYAYIPYTLLILPALITSVRLALSRKNSSYLLHFLLCWYVLGEIIIQYTRKLFGYTPQLKSYDGKITICQTKSFEEKDL